jgi:hypothetical protein
MKSYFFEDLSRLLGIWVKGLDTSLTHLFNLKGRPIAIIDCPIFVRIIPKFHKIRIGSPLKPNFLLSSKGSERSDLLPSKIEALGKMGT